MNAGSGEGDNIARFDRKFFESSADFMSIGEGELGGKARGLAFIDGFLKTRFPHSEFPGITVNIPRLAALTTDIFDAFMTRNRLRDIAFSEESDETIARAFIAADFPAEYTGDLMALISRVNRPLAVRSSSLLEDAMRRPFAGVYATKMTPNNQFNPEARFNKLIEAVKFVYASTYFREAKSYIRAAGANLENERMGVIIQEVVGTRNNSHFYPSISGVGKSFNYYTFGKAQPEEGVVNLALGLGRTIVDGGLIWSYCPAYPKAVPPCASPQELLKTTQLDFWAVEMGEAPFDPLKETEYEIKGSISEAENEGALDHIASTYIAASDKVYPGIGSDGPRILNFAPILVYRQLPLNDVVKLLLEISREAAGAEVEIEFAVTLGPDKGYPVRVGFLQVRPMVSPDRTVEVSEGLLSAEEAAISSDRVMGNGIWENIRDVIYIDPDKFEAKHTRSIAQELEALNNIMVQDNQPYVLIGFGRWGSSDPWLGIPVNWGQISGARVIVEATLEGMSVDLSQGSHFFHNLTSFGVPYFSVRHDIGASKIKWDWLRIQKTVSEMEFIRRVRTDEPLKVMVDGRKGKGVILYG